MRTLICMTAILTLGCSNPRTDHANGQPSAAQPAASKAAASPQEPTPTHPAQDSAGPHGALADSDFVPVGFETLEDSAAIRKKLGAPESVGVEDNLFEPGSKLITWNYPTIRFDFFSRASVAGYTLLKPGPKTARGLQVGDSTDRVLQLYGEPTGKTEGHGTRDWEYRQPGGGEPQIMTLSIVAGRVREIYLGSELQ